MSGEKLTGCWISMFSPIAAEIMADAGYDVAMIDLEHAPGGLMESISMMHAVECRGCQPLIRSSSSDIVDIKRILDVGPAGIMIPNIRDAEHAEATVAHCRYAPLGDRGAAPGYIHAMGYAGKDGRARNGKEYSTYMKEDFLVILQVESSEGVKNIEEIVKVDGIDMILVGPADLSASLGKLGDFANQNFSQAMSAIETATRSAGLALGTIPFGDWSAERHYRSGYQLVISGADTMLLTSAAREDLQHLRASAASS